MRLLIGIWISGTTSQLVVAPLDQIAVGDEFRHRRPSAAEAAFCAEGLADGRAQIVRPWALCRGAPAARSPYAPAERCWRAEAARTRRSLEDGGLPAGPHRARCRWAR